MPLRAFTTSWDDGNPLDLKLADLLAKYGFQGTFYIPRNNAEGAVIDTAGLRELAERFEIASHTLDHVELDTVPANVASQQIVDGKRRLEDELGAPIVGFCYPRGVHNPAIRAAVKHAGFRYARTVVNFATESPSDLLRVPTTLQFFPHRPYTYLKNFASGRDWHARAAMFSIALRNRFEDTLQQMLAHVCTHGGVFHVWGHSWELERFGLWGALERFLKAAQQVVPNERRVDNATAYAAIASS